MGIETPNFLLVDKDQNIEVRDYQSYIIAEVNVLSDSYASAGNQAFGLLADYIFGNNKSKVKLSMTAPVSTKKSSENNYTVSFMMPSAYSMKSLPLPNSQQIQLREIKSHRAIAISFSGITKQSKINQMNRQIKEWAKQHHTKIIGEPVFARFDPPWKPGIFRHNEIIYAVKE